MKTDIKDRWVKALRSGDYKQGVGALRTTHHDKKRPDEFCCLGVLCELAVKDGVIPEATFPEDDSSYGEYGENLATGSLPSEVIAWSGLQDSSGSYTDSVGDRQDVIHLNDGRQYGFPKIADQIERYL